MPTVRKAQSVAANTRGTNVLNETQFQTASRKWGAAIYATCTATGMELDAFVDGEEMCRASVVNISANPPIIPDDLNTPGIVIFVSNNFIVVPVNVSAGVLVASLAINFTPLR